MMPLIHDQHHGFISALNQISSQPSTQPSTQSTNITISPKALTIFLILIAIAIYGIGQHDLGFYLLAFTILLYCTIGGGYS